MKNIKVWLTVTTLSCLPLTTEAKTLLSDIVSDTPLVKGEKNVIINADEKVYIDSSVDIDTLTINGTLSCESDTMAEIKAKTIYVNGAFGCGSNANPFNGKLYISLKHSSIDPKASHAYRGLIVNNGGKLILKGNTRRSGYFKLYQTANPGDNFLKVNNGDIASKWSAGDTIAIGPTSYNPAESEDVVIKEITGTTVYLASPVKYRHWGETEVLNTQRGKVTLDQRAEVANLTRNIVIRADESDAPISEANIPGAQLGGHVMSHKGGATQIDAVEFSRMGQAGIMARYPFHWHFAGDVPGQYIRNSSIHHSFQRCITIHQTNKARVEDNVCYRFKGHGFFLEDGNEVDNVIAGNLGIYAMYPSSTKRLLASDTSTNESGVVANRFPAVSVFWISNPQNTVTRNVAAGSVGTGFWMAFVPNMRQFDRGIGDFRGEVFAKPLTTDTTEFSYNSAHSTMVGHTWDGAPMENPYNPVDENPYHMHNPNNPMDRKLNIAHYDPPTIPIFRGLIAYKNIQTGVYFRGVTAVFEDAIFAENGRSFFLAFNQIVRNSVIVGRSRNHTPADDKYLYTYQNYGFRQSGIVMYDGPWELQTVDFINFPSEPQYVNVDGKNIDYAPIPIHTVGGQDKFTNITSKLRFSPEPLHRLFMEHLEGKTGWLEEVLSNSIKDLDGTLTGTPGSVLLPSAAFTNAPGCFKKSFSGKDSFYPFNVCPPKTNYVTVNFTQDGPQGSKIPFVIRRSDAKYSMPREDWEWLDAVGNLKRGILSRKSLLVGGENYSYDILLKESVVEGGFNDLQIYINAPIKNELSPVMNIKGIGADCSLEGIKRVESRKQLEAATDDAYYSSGNDFAVRLKTKNLFYRIKPSDYSVTDESQSLKPIISCKSPTINTVIGNIESVSETSAGTLVQGWACDYGVSESIEVHIFAGGPAGKGDLVGRAIASQESEPFLNFACADPSMTNHRFRYVIPESVRSKYPGEDIHVHGISASGNSNLVIKNSGTFKLSGIRQTATTVKGNLNAPSTLGRIGGWACEYGFNRQSQVEIYAGTKLLRTVRTNIIGESAVSAACGTSGVAHRFQLDLTDQELRENQGQTISAYGLPVSYNGTKRKLGQSGVQSLPRYQVKGNVERVFKDGSNIVVSGWACDHSWKKQINVHVYVGGAAGKGGENVGSVLASNPSETAVATACNDPAKLGHRFKFILPSYKAASLKGKPVYVHGISGTGGMNLVIGNSGKFTLP